MTFPETQNKNFMFSKKLILLSIMSIAYMANAQHEGHQGDPSSSHAFDQVSALVGTWEGTYEWLGTERKGSIKAIYTKSGNAAVIENLFQDGQLSMTSVYHKDNAKLRMTHFCVNNQPRLIVEDTSLPNQLVFTYLDVTNVKSPEDGHVHRVKLVFVDNRHIQIEFTFKSKSRESIERIDLAKVS